MESNGELHTGIKCVLSLLGLWYVVRGCAKKLLDIFCGFNNILEIVHTDKVKYFLCISEFYLFVSYLVKCKSL